MHKAYDENPTCPCCFLAISQAYMRDHLLYDHRKSEIAAMLAKFSIDDFKQMLEPIEA